MMQWIKRTIPFPSFFSSRINDWAETLLPLYRTAIPMIMLNMLAPRVQTVHIQPSGIILSVSFMYGLTFAVHTLSAFSSLHMDYNHGFLYETSRAILPSEFILFFYFLQYDITLAVMLLAMLACGMILLLTAGYQHLICCYQHGYIPRALFTDIVFSLKKTPRSHILIYTAFRRYLVIGTAVLFTFPSISAFSMICTENAAAYGNVPLVKAAAEKRLLQHAHIIHLLSEDQWQLLSVQEQTDVLQVVADIETSYMQIKSVTVKNCHLENNVIGAYNLLKREVQIDLGKHKRYSSLEYINTILHECRHAYQHDCINSLNWNDPSIQNGIYYAQARQWRYEHQYYISSSENYDDYYFQTIEIDARHYAEEGVNWYQQHLYSENPIVP